MSFLINLNSSAFIAPNNVWIVNSTATSSIFANNVRYTPLRNAQSDYIEFQFIASALATNLQIIYAMSSSESNGVRLRLDTLKLASADNPTTSVTTGTAFTVTTSSDVLIHSVTNSHSSDLTINTTIGNIIYGKLTRFGNDAVDTHTGDMRVLEIRII